MSTLTQDEAREEQLLEATSDGWYICTNNKCRESRDVSTTEIGYPDSIMCGRCAHEMRPETSTDVPVRHIKTQSQAKAEAQIRWGIDGDAWGGFPYFFVGCWNHDLLEPLQTVQGRGAAWADAFNHSEENRGHYHFCGTCERNLGKSHLCFQNCGEVPGVCDQIRAIRRGEVGYKCKACGGAK